MKVLLVNGGPHKTGCTYTALEEVALTLREAGVETEIVWLGVKPLAGCIGCGSCAEKKACFRDDGHHFVHGPCLLCGQPPGRVCREAGCSHCQLSARGRYGHLRPAKQILHHQLHARSIFAILEHGAWQHARRGTPGPRRPADHAHAGTQHGVALALHRGRTAGGYRLPSRSGRAVAHELYPVMWRWNEKRAHRKRPLRGFRCAHYVF